MFSRNLSNSKGDLRLFCMMIPLGLEVGSETKFDNCKRFVGHDFLEVVFLFRTPRTNNKADIKSF